LLAGFASISSHGTLSVVGTRNNDDLRVEFSGSHVLAKRNGQTLSFNKSDVKRIWMHGYGGDDTLRNATNLPATLVGGAGKDRLVVGSARHELYPGDFPPTDGEAVFAEDGDTLDYSTQAAGFYGVQAGADVGSIERPGGIVDYLEAHFSIELNLYFTPGNDWVSAGVRNALSSNWRYFLGAGNDRFDTAGNPFVDGEAGDDQFFFNYDSPIDTIQGGSGNDIIHDDSGYGSGADFDGGSGFDTWIVNPDLPLNGANVYTRTIPAGIEKYVLGIEAPVKITANSPSNVIRVSSAGGATVKGGAGNDVIEVNNGFNEFSQTTGTALLQGGSGDDILIGGIRGDVFQGGSGIDIVDYSARSDNLDLSLDNHDNDGALREHDNIGADIEVVIGGKGDDLIIGNPFNNTLAGNAGNDTLWGGDGNDLLNGGSGHDKLYGQGGNDTLLANDGAKDSLDGGSGFDTASRDNSSSVADQVLNVEAFV
jgi:Ca2+-binding RTX toxin-like protein